MSKKILIVDDEPELVELFSDILKTAGYDIFKAYDGREAMHVVQENMPDLILLDVKMPGVDGFTFLAQLRDDPKLAHIKVIMLSNMQGQEYLDQATALGSDDYWYKMDTHLVDLVEKVNGLL
ncbi:MAG: response regulator [Patescibacteria group bacterium]